MRYLRKKLTEDVILVKIESVLAEKYVPPEYEIYIDSSSRANLLLINQNNSEYRYDGRNLGIADDVLHWLRIVKPADSRYVPGTEITMKTASWYSLFLGSSNIRSRELWRSSGIEEYRIQKVRLNREGEKTIDGNERMYNVKAAVQVQGWGSKARLTVIGNDTETLYLPEGKVDAYVHTFTNVCATTTLSN
ncbi:MAG: hypothetical protein P8X73_04010 [Ignavibacteriaceae bacterium]